MHVSMTLETENLLADIIERRTGRLQTWEDPAFLTCAERDMLAAKLYSAKTAAQIIADRLAADLDAALQDPHSETDWVLGDQHESAYCLASDIAGLVSPF